MTTIATVARATAVRAPAAMLQLGSRGPEVLKLQKALQAAGFNPQGLDGSFGPKTQAALRSFQKAARIVVDGKAGPQTWGALSRWGKPSSTALPSLKVGAQGTNVRTLQSLLDKHGFRSGGVDGKFGPVTHAAVVRFQKAKGLQGTGQVGPKTWALLNGPVKGPAPAAPTSATGKIDRVLNWARSMRGTPYASANPFRFGEVLWDGKAHKSVNGSSATFKFPKGTRVFDCSGFVVTAFKQIGVDLKARGLTSTWSMRDNTSFLKPVTRAQVKPGDLIFYKPRNGVGHVVIYQSNGKCVEAAGGVGVVARDVQWDRLYSIRRVPVS